MRRRRHLAPVADLIECPPDIYDAIAEQTEYTLATAYAYAAHAADERLIALTGRARPLPHRRPVMTTRNRWMTLYAENVTDPMAYAVALKAEWSIGADADTLAAWFKAAQECAMRAHERAQAEAPIVVFGGLPSSTGWVTSDDPSRFPNRYDIPARSDFTPIRVDARGPDGTCRLCNTPAEAEHTMDCPSRIGADSELVEHLREAVAERFEQDGSDG